MNFKRGTFFGFVLVLMFSFVSLMSLSFAVYPDFEFTQTSYSSGIVDVVGRSSSGTQVNLNVNGIAVGVGQDVFSASQNISVSSNSMPGANVGIGSSVAFVNGDIQTVWLKFSDGGDCILATGGSCVKKFSNEGSISVTNGNNASIAAGVIVVADELVDFIFSGVENHFKNGNNDLKFVQKSGNSFGTSVEFDYVVSYQKYTNVITINEFENATNKREVTISGGIGDSTHELFYTLNIDPDTLGNLGALNKVEHLGTAFNVTITGLNEGVNDIYFLTTQPNNNKVFTGVTQTSVLVDSIAPTLEIVSAQFSNKGNVYEINSYDNVYINGNSLILNISCDASVINVTLNNVTSQTEVVNDSASVTLSLVKGANNLTLTAIDAAGNIAKQAHQINFDDTLPQIVDGSLKPTSMFEKGVARFFFEDIDGQVNKGDVTVTIFTIGGNAKDHSGTPITCDMFENVYLQGLARNTGLSGSRSFVRRDGDVSYEPNATQISMTNLMFGKRTVTTDASGNFDALIGLQEKTYNYGDLNKAERDADKVASDNNNRNPTTKSVKSKNTICFVMQDKFGNLNIQSRMVTLDAGNTMWKPGEITTIPNTMYASEIADTGDLRQGTGNVEFGMIARFTYIGSGTVNSITAFKMRLDTDISEYGKYARIDNSRINFKYDKNTDEMIVYAPVIIYPFGSLKPADYPSEAKFGFKAFPTYTVGDKDIPIDTRNPIYFQITMNIERPLDHTKWLTPEMIEQTQEFLNKTIEFTETAVEWTGYASIAGVLTCTAYKFKYGFDVAKIKAGPGDDSDKKIEIDAAKRKMFMICDRVACTSSPYECEKPRDGEGFFNVWDSKTNETIMDPKSDDVKNDKNAQFTMKERDGENGELMGRVTDFKITDAKSSSCMVGDTPGVIVTADVTKYEKDGYLWVTTKEKSEQLLREQCVEATWVDKDGKVCVPKIVKGERVDSCQVSKVNLQGVSGVCYTKGAPKFDDTRCNAGGLTFGMMDTPLAGWEPADDVIESLACGCITDTYSHLKNYLKIQKSIYMCLEQAKIGNVQGSYCERLLGQAVCDVATNLVFKTIVPQVSKRTNTEGEDEHDKEPSFFEGFYDGLKDGDKLLNDRYQGTFWTQSGLGTEQIVNKVCLASLTGDWSTFTDNVLSDIDKNEVEPVFGPMIPESRMQGYNPLTGQLSIMYRMTYGAVSGGQYIRSKLTFICDKNEKNGEYCPDSGFYSSDSSGSGIKSRTYSVSKGGSVSDLIVVTDTDAKFWFNVVELEHTYELKGAKKTYVQRENIIHKGEVISSCYFTGGVLGSGAGFDCESIFSDEASMSMFKIDDASLLPSEQQNVFYPGNDVILDMDYSINGQGDQGDFYVAYLAECLSSGKGGKTTRFGQSQVNVDLSRGNAYRTFTLKGEPGKNSGGMYLTSGTGKAYVNLFGIPKELGTDTGNKGSKSYSYGDASTLCNGDVKDYYIKFESNDVDKTAELKIDSIEGLNFESTVSRSGSQTKFTCKDGATKFSFSIFITNNVEVGVSPIIYNGSNEEIGSFKPDTSTNYADSQEFDNLKEGDCNLYLRLLPGNKISTIGADNFKNYSTVNNDNSDILVDRKLAGMGGMKEMSFRVGRSDNNKKAFFELLTPYEGQSFCVEMDKDKKPMNLKIPINYYYQTRGSDDKGQSGKLSLKINNERFGSDLININKDVNGNFEEPVEKSVLNNYMADGFLTDATVSYKFVDEFGGEHIGATKHINLALSEDCSNTKKVVYSSNQYDNGNECKDIDQPYCNDKGEKFEGNQCVVCGSDEELEGNDCVSKGTIKKVPTED